MTTMSTARRPDPCRAVASGSTSEGAATSNPPDVVRSSPGLGSPSMAGSGGQRSSSSSATSSGRSPGSASSSWSGLFPTAPVSYSRSLLGLLSSSSSVGGVSGESILGRVCGRAYALRPPGQDQVEFTPTPSF